MKLIKKLLRINSRTARICFSYFLGIFLTCLFGVIAGFGVEPASENLLVASFICMLVSGYFIAKKE